MPVPGVEGRRMSLSLELGSCPEFVVKSTCWLRRGLGPDSSPFCEHLAAWLGTALIYKGFCALGSGARYLENYLYEEIH